jgi:hypothetical protein
MIVFDVDVLDTYYFIICQDFEYEIGLKHYTETK